MSDWLHNLPVFATGVAASVLLIASHDRPFTGEISVASDPLLQVIPEAEAGQQGMNQTRDPAGPPRPGPK
jgi:hypothetical protein